MREPPPPPLPPPALPQQQLAPISALTAPPPPPASSGPSGINNSPGPSKPAGHTPVRRTRLGCLTCRQRRVKCDESKPVCKACRRLERECHWQDLRATAAPRLPRRPNATACEACRARKLRCEGDRRQGSCVRCQQQQIKCEWAEEDLHPPAKRPGSSHSTTSGASSVPAKLSTALADTEMLIDRYFDTVHHFGFLTFVHPLRFKKLLSKGKAPKELTMAMVANVLRFGCDPTPANLAKSDSLIDGIVGSLVPRVMQGFGVIQLMALILTAHCETQRNNFTSSWLIIALSVRMMQMMSLQKFDQTLQAGVEETPLSPLLSCEALRRVAWAVFYLDAVIDGGRFGDHLTDITSFRIQLPCHEDAFLANENIRTEPLWPSPSQRNPHSLGISAFVLRASVLRRRALHCAYRVSQKEDPTHVLQADIDAASDEVAAFIDSLPSRYLYSEDNMYMHRKRLPAYVILHLLRHNLFVILGRAKLLLHEMDPLRYKDLDKQARYQRIQHALPVAAILEEALKYDPVFDTHAGVHAYVTLEIILFEPRRLASTDAGIDPKSSEFARCIPPLLRVIRELGRRSAMMKTMHIEAVHRLLRCDWLPLLEPYDLETFSTEYQPVGQDEAEYDFRDFRFAKLERARRYSQPNQALSSEALLEFRDRDDSPDDIVGGDLRGVSDVRSRPEDRVSDLRGDRDRGYHRDRFDRDRFERGYQRDPRFERPDLPRLDRPDPRDPRSPRDPRDPRDPRANDRYDRPSDHRDPRDMHQRDVREMRDVRDMREMPDIRDARDMRDRAPPSSSTHSTHSSFARPRTPPPPEQMPGGMSYLPLQPAVPFAAQPVAANNAANTSTGGGGGEGAHPWLALFDPTAGQQGLDDLSWMLSLGAVGVSTSPTVNVGLGGVGVGVGLPINGAPLQGPLGAPGPPPTEFWKQVM